MKWQISNYTQETSKWQTTVSSKNIKTESNKPLTEQEKMLQFLKDDYAKEEKSQAISSIYSKIKSGSVLTEKEKEYLKENSPDLYEEVVEIEKERKEMKEKMEKAKSKKEVEEIYNQKIQQFATESQSVAQNGTMSQGEKYDAMEKIGNRLAGVMAEYDKFVKSEEYAKLPNDDEDENNTIKIKEDLPQDEKVSDGDEEDASQIPEGTLVLEQSFSASQTHNSNGSSNTSLHNSNGSSTVSSSQTYNSNGSSTTVSTPTYSVNI